MFNININKRHIIIQKFQWIIYSLRHRSCLESVIGRFLICLIVMEILYEEKKYINIVRILFLYYNSDILFR